MTGGSGRAGRNCVVINEPIGLVVVLGACVVIGLPLLCGILYLAYLVLTLPLRRNEQFRLLLDLLELGLRAGRTPEAAFLEAAASREPALGPRFLELAGQLHHGLRLSAALEQVPHVLPPQVCGMLRAGERIGDVAKVLPACRQLLRDGVSQVRGANNYIVLLAFCITPATLLLPILIGVKVLPQFRMIFENMGGMQLPAFTSLVFSQGNWFVLTQAVFLALLWLLLIAYVGGPKLRDWLNRLLPGGPDALALLLPWRRQRLQRDFSTMLAVLLDAGMPEAEAASLAAAATANRKIIRRGEQMRTLLAQGVKLPEALRVMDDSGELRWRLTNALHAGRGFLRALTGWHDALDARAFQAEQAGAQLATTGLILINGVMVATLVIAVFLLLIKLINEACLW